MNNQTNSDDEYKLIVDDILSNDEFVESMKELKHHNSNRLDHSLKVSYRSYKIAKRLGLDYVGVARGGLLHDFYLDSITDKKSIKDKVMLYTLNHPKDALDNAQNIFGVTEKEADIIRSHMFPLDISVPKYAESWIVNVVDTCISTQEFSNKFKAEIAYTTNLLVLFLINMVRIG